MNESIKKLTKAEVEDLMPQQFPFLFLEDAQIEGDKIKSTYHIRGDEFFLEGHFKNNPVFPATLSLEASGQLGILYLLASDDKRLEKKTDSSKMFFVSADGLRCTRICRPGDVLEIEMQARTIKRPLSIFKGTIYVNGEKASIADKICLTFDYKE